MSYCGLMGITEERPQFEESCHVQMLSKPGFAIAKTRSMGCDLIGQRDRAHIISYSSFMQMTWRVRHYAILRKQVPEGRLSMLAGWGVCFGYDSGMIRV